MHGLKNMSAGNQERVETTTGCVLNQQHREGDREGSMHRDKVKNVEQRGRKRTMRDRRREEESI